MSIELEKNPLAVEIGSKGGRPRKNAMLEIQKKPAQKFEYDIFPRYSISKTVLNLLGSEGWELCGTMNNELFFKRPVQ